MPQPGAVTQSGIGMIGGGSMCDDLV